MNKLKYYIHSFRLRTLPLSVSGIILGGLLAKSVGEFNGIIFTLAIITTLLLQIVSNLANELGDLQKGTDNQQRLGPIRSIQSGALNISEFKRTLILLSVLALLSGLYLVFSAFHNLINIKSIIMLLLGGLALAAAIKYTIGKHAYGYYGLGDIFVFIFFGIISTAGCYFLMTHQIEYSISLPASAIGLLSTGVLNINNIRDIENDKACNKSTIPVKIGEKNAKRYHIMLIILAFICMSVYDIYFVKNLYGLIFWILSPFFIIHIYKVIKLSGKRMDSQLKYLSILTLLFSLLAGIGLII